RKSFYYHYYEYPGPHKVRRHYGVVTARYKLVYFYESDMGYWELFDLEKDPHELRSAYGQKEYADVQQELEKELARLRAELKVPERARPEPLIKPRGGQGGHGGGASRVGGRAEGDECRPSTREGRGSRGARYTSAGEREPGGSSCVSVGKPVAGKDHRGG